MIMRMCANNRVSLNFEASLSARAPDASRDLQYIYSRPLVQRTGELIIRDWNWHGPQVVDRNGVVTVGQQIRVTKVLMPKEWSRFEGASRMIMIYVREYVQNLEDCAGTALEKLGRSLEAQMPAQASAQSVQAAVSSGAANDFEEAVIKAAEAWARGEWRGVRAALMRRLGMPPDLF